MMKRLWYAIGNDLRGDDGVAHRVAAECRGGAQEILTVHQLTPEVALEMAGADEVVFLDADARAESVRLERIDLSEGALPPGLDASHRLTPRTLVALAMRLYGFAGRAYLCRIPAVEFGVGSRLSTVSEQSARETCRILSRLRGPVEGYRSRAWTGDGHMPQEERVRLQTPSGRPP